MNEVIDENDKQILLSYMKSGLYLPKELRDFHDQKDIFKTIGNRNIEYDREINWVSGQIYTIDHFLWFMGLHGYELKKTKSKKIPRFDLNSSIENQKEEDAKAFKSMIQNK